MFEPKEAGSTPCPGGRTASYEAKTTDHSAEEPMAMMSTSRATLFITIFAGSIGLRIQVKIPHPELQLAS